MDSPSKTFPIGVMIAAGLALLSCWMPWATFIGKPHTSAAIPSFFLSQMEPIEITITGWNGSLTIMGVSSPNWTTGCCAGIIAVLTVIRFLGRIRVTEMILLLLGLYGVLHTGAVLLMVINSEPGNGSPSLGIGLLLAFACFGVLSFFSLRAFRSLKVPPVSRPRPAREILQRR
jgi:hypothetical protein